MKAGVCFLQSYPNLMSALEGTSPVTKSQLKKLGEKKKFWEAQVEPRKCYEISLNSLNYLKINPSCSNEKIKPLKETENFIAVSKPFNCHSHPLSYEEDDTVLNYIRQNWPGKVLEVNHNHYDRGLLYRLDYETSGLMLYCKKEYLHRELRENFGTLVEEKIYYAIVQGNFSSRELSHKIVYGGPKNCKATAFDFSHSEGITAKLDARKISHNQKEDVTLVAIKLKEGHRHQIRVQFAAEGMPLLGDVLYGGKPAQRLFLHCFSYRVKGEEFQDDNLELFSLFFDFDG